MKKIELVGDIPDLNRLQEVANKYFPDNSRRAALLMIDLCILCGDYYNMGINGVVAPVSQGGRG